MSSLPTFQPDSFIAADVRPSPNVDERAQGRALARQKHRAFARQKHRALARQKRGSTGSKCST
jgi:hypothetical protein